MENRVSHRPLPAEKVLLPQHAVLKRTNQVNYMMAALVLATGACRVGAWCPCVKWPAGPVASYVLTVFLITGTTCLVQASSQKPSMVNAWQGTVGATGKYNLSKEDPQVSLDELDLARSNELQLSRRKECVPERSRVWLTNSMYGILSHPLLSLLVHKVGTCPSCP